MTLLPIKYAKAFTNLCAYLGRARRKRGLGRDNLSRGQIVKAACYFAFGGVLFALFLALGLLWADPEPLVRKALAAQQAVSVDFSNLQGEGIIPLFTARGVDIRDARSNAPLLFFDKLEISPSLSSLLTGRFAVNIQAVAHGGAIQAKIGTGVLFNTKRFSLQLDANELDLSSFPWLTLFNRPLKGYGDIAVSYSGALNDLKTLEGSASININDFTIPLFQPLFSVNQLNFAVVQAEFSQSFLHGRIEKISLDGDKMSTSLSGNVGMVFPHVLDSTLDLQGKMKADVSILKGSFFDPNAIKRLGKGETLPIKVSGTIWKPFVAL